MITQLPVHGYTSTFVALGEYCGRIEATVSNPMVPSGCPATSAIPLYNDDHSGGFQLTTSGQCSTAARPALAAVTFTFTTDVTLRYMTLGLRQATEPLPLTINLTVGSTWVVSPEAAVPPELPSRAAWRLHQQDLHTHPC